MIVTETTQLKESRRILLGDDNVGDVELLELAIASQGISIHVETLGEGDSVLLRLKELIANPDRSIRLVILDRRLPRRSAEEIMVALAEQRVIVKAPVLVFSSFVSDTERKRLYELGVTAVLEKPGDWHGYVRLASELDTLCC